MAEAPNISTGERMRESQLRSRMSGFTRFVFGSCLLAMICGFAVGVMEAAGPGAEQGSYKAASGNDDYIARPPSVTWPRKREPRPPASHQPRPQTPKPAPLIPVKPVPETLKPAVQDEPPPVIVDDPTPEPPPIIDDPEAGPKTTDKPGTRDLFEVPGIDSGPPKLIKQADELTKKSIEYFKHYRKTDSRRSMNGAKQSIQRAIQMYRRAKKMYPNDASIDKKLNEANQLNYMYMKSSRI